MILDSETKAVELPEDHGDEIRLWLRLLTCTTLSAAVDYEAEYNNRARVPEHPAHFAGWVRDAVAYREKHAPRSIIYGPGARNRIDYFPGGGDSAIVVFIHGGYWQAFDGSFF